MTIYQVMPSLSDADFGALKADIAKRGVKIAVEYDREGNIIDGYHRVRACEELGIAKWPRKVRSYKDEAAKLTQARKLNLARRHLDTNTKQALIAAELQDRPGDSNRVIATDLGVSHPIVSTVRKNLESTGKIYQLPTTKGKDGKQGVHVHVGPEK